MVKATMTAIRDKNKFKIPTEIRRMAIVVAKCRNPVLRKDLRKKLGRPEGNLVPGWVRFPGKQWPKACCETNTDQR